MRIYIAELLKEKTGVMDFSTKGDLNWMTEKEEWDIAWPISVVGSIYNNDGLLTLIGKARGVVLLKCCRCLESFAWPLYLDLEEEFTQKIGEDSLDVNLYSGDYLDIDQVVYSNIVLSLPMKPLCTIECKGICPQCGANLNYESCQCKHEEVDMRLKELSKWFERS